jgi:glycosyltransferase involved in cell wall biosynthesis
LKATPLEASNSFGSGRIKVVFLIGSLGLGGSERQLYLLLRHLDRGRFACRVLVFNSSPAGSFQRSLESIGVEVHPVPAGCSSIARRMVFLYQQLRCWQPQIVHSWTVHDNPYAGVVGGLAGVPLRIGSLRSSLHLQGFRSLPALLRRLALFSVDRLLVNTEALRKELLAIDLPADRVAALPNGVEIPAEADPAPDLAEFGIRNAQPVIGLVANFRRVKNHLLFVQGLAEVLPRFPEARALIFGQPLGSEPGLQSQILNRIETLGLGKRIILGGFRPDAPRLMRGFHLLCLTSTSEGTPNVILEAMAAGCPVVATAVGGVPRLVRDQVTGLLVPSRDSGALARAVGELLANPARARKMGRAGRQFVARDFSIQRPAAELARYYLSWLQAKRIPDSGGPRALRSNLVK